MRKILICSVLLVFLFNIDAQNKNQNKYLIMKIIKTDKNGTMEKGVFNIRNKEIARLLIDEKGGITGITGKIPDGVAVKSFYDNGNLETETVFKNNKLEGIIKSYYKNGVLQAEVICKNGLWNGLARMYNENGKLDTEAYFIDGKLNGIRKIYFESGNLKSETGYKDGKKDGIEKIYLENGSLISETNYINDKKDGVEKNYYKNGRLKSEAGYKDGKKDGIEKDYFDDGSLSVQYNYQNNVIIGKEFFEVKRSCFINFENLDIKEYPKIIQVNGGFSNDPDVMDYSFIKFYYEYVSKVILAAIPEEPRNTVSVTLKDPKNNIYSREFKNEGKKEYYIYRSDPVTKKWYKNPVIALPFKNIAKFQSGEWKVTITVDNDTNKTVSGIINIQMEKINILKDDINSPFNNYDKSRTFIPGEVLYIYGESRATDSELLLSVYKQTEVKGRYQDELVLSPFTGTKVKTDENGKYNAVFQTGKEIPAGRYFIVTGKTPELLETDNRNAVSGDFVFYIK